MRSYFKKTLARWIKAPTPTQEADLPINIEDFFALPVGDIMIPRSDIIAVSSKESFETIVAMFLKVGFYWLPVYRETLDHIIGLVSIHCVLSLEGPVKNEERWYRHLNAVSFVPTFMTIGEALQKLQHPHKPGLLFIVDEYGGIEGLITKGKILRELSAFGLPHSEEEEMILERDPILVVSGRMELEAFIEEFGTPELLKETLKEDSRFSTLGGWLCAFLGRVPLKGEVIEHPAGFTFEIREADPRKIHQIAVIQMPTLK